MTFALLLFIELFRLIRVITPRQNAVRSARFKRLGTT